MSATTVVFVRYYLKLIRILPMNDDTFMRELFHHGLLPGDIMDKLKKQLTAANKATYFLDNVIKPSVTADIDISFDKLLDVMECSAYLGMKELAKLIRGDMREKENDNTNNGLRIS